LQNKKEQSSFINNNHDINIKNELNDQTKYIQNNLNNQENDDKITDNCNNSSTQRKANKNFYLNNNEDIKSICDWINTNLDYSLFIDEDFDNIIENCPIFKDSMF